jgi:hypothetical protein
MDRSHEVRVTMWPLLPCKKTPENHSSEGAR